jgi:hypothetical protein
MPRHITGQPLRLCVEDNGGRPKAPIRNRASTEIFTTFMPGALAFTAVFN